ncbi:MAG TPA: LysR substrate-binding domain-containing protein [Acetobacteraceae bacterium]|nr:LysR substrate-binding domain-containing protein [Acetobacteraceae bacterium]
MSIPAGLDPDLLRAFVYIAEDGSFTRAAERVGRTQSAVSMQVQRLESLLGEKVLLRGKGGAVQLTPHGRYLLERARELLTLNDEIWSAFREPSVRGTVRLGTPDDYAMRFLPPVLKRLAHTHPAVEVDVLCLPSNELVERLKEGELDLTLCSETHEPRNWPTTPLWQGPLQWITSERHAPHRIDPLPLAISAKKCAWRQAAISTLEKAGRRYRIGYTSATLAGTHVPVLAGLAVTVSPITTLPEGLRVLRPEEGMPELPGAGILLLKGRNPTQPVTDVLAAHIAETFRQEVRAPERVAA